MSVDLAERLLPADEVCARTTLAKRTMYRMIREGHFPPPIHTSPKRRAWPESEVAAWIDKQKRARK